MLRKISITAFILIVVAALGLLVFGLSNPSVSYETKIEINKPRDVVWKYFNDPNKMGEWLDGFQKIETISGNATEAGSKYRLTFVEDGQEIVLVQTMTEFRPNEFFAFDLENEMFSNHVAVSLAETGGVTTVIQKEKMVGANIFWKILFAAMKSVSQERANQTLNKLKANIENL